MTTLRELLETYHQAALQQMAEFQGLSVPANVNQSRLASDLARHYSSPEYLRKTLAVLNATEQAVIEAILVRGGTALVSNVRHVLLEAGYLAPKQIAQPDPDPLNGPLDQLDTVLARLTARGLVFNLEATANPGGSYRVNSQRRRLAPSAHVFIPEGLIATVKAVLPTPEPASLAAPPPAHIESQLARTFQRDLYLYWSYVRDNGSRITTKGELYKRDLADINAILVASEPLNKRSENQVPRLLYLRGLLQAHKLLAVLPDNHIEALTQAMYFSQSLADRVERSYNRYISGDFVNELAWVPGFTIYSGVEPVPAPPLIIEARQRVLDYVREAAREQAVDGWIQLEGLKQRIQTYDYEFLFRRAPSSSVYASAWEHFNPYNPYSHPLGWGFPDIPPREEQKGWSLVEGPFIAEVITGPLHWMGLVELGYTSTLSEQPVSFRLTELGAWLMGLGSQPDLQTHGGRLIVQPNFQIVALDPVGEDTLAQLDQFAERQAADRAVEYQLTRNSVYNGQQVGWTAEDVIAFLNLHSANPLPDNISRTLHEWQTRHERIVVYPRVGLLHAANPQVMTQLTENPVIATVLGERIDAQASRLHETSSATQVAEVLLAEGWLPVVNTGAEPLSGVLTVSRDGVVKFRQSLTSLYVHRVVRQFAEAHPNPNHQVTYRITEASVTQAAAAGLTAPELLNRLGMLHHGSLPPDLVTSIRAWMQHFGTAKLETVTVLQMRSPQILRDLLEDPEIEALLEPMGGEQTGLARVRTADLGKLRAVLASRGIDIADTLR